MQPMSDFAVQLNKNSFGLSVSEQMSISTPIQPGQSVTASVICVTNMQQVQRMEPLTNLQVSSFSLGSFKAATNLATGKLESESVIERQ